MEARADDSIAAALAAAGVWTTGISRGGRSRGHFCGMGVCQDCVVIVDGHRGRRACMTPVAEGMAVQALAEAESRPAKPATPAPVPEEIGADIAIIGAGPAGLQAALVAREGGASVVLIDERAESGGQYFKPRSEGFRGRHRHDSQHRRGIDLRRRVAAAGADIRTQETVWFARATGSGFHLRTDGPIARARIAVRAIILATGAMERPALVPGWTLPGVTTIGAAQTLVRRYGIAPGRRILVAGHGPLGIQLGAELLRTQANVAAVADRASLRPGSAIVRMAAAAPGLTLDGLRYLAQLKMASVELLSGWEIIEIFGEGCAEGGRLRHIGRGAERMVEADSICLGDGFAPQTELARLLGVPVRLDSAASIVVPERAADGATSVPGLWIAGDAGGLGGAALAEAQGRLAGAGALGHLRKSVPGLGSAHRRARRARAFQAALWDLYKAPPRAAPAHAAIVCRCEDVTAGGVRAAIAAGARDPGTLKRATRLGMGRCQGRYCTSAALQLFAEAGFPQPPEALFAPQLPVRPVRLQQLASEKPEWGGHRESTPGARPSRPPGDELPQTRADLVVVGAGITGVSAALFAARRGANVVCLDRGRINGEASGGNAGSLHLQLLSWDFGDKAVAGGSPQLRTLPLQKESIKLWSELESQLAADFGLRITGGLMVAESETQAAFLQAKVAAEASMGIAVEMVGRTRIQEIVPDICDRIVAGAWCPGEGKIDPLVATSALADAARRAGAEIEEQTAVTGLDTSGGGYVIHTSRGRLLADRVLIAAGGWSADVAGRLGVRIPVRGAPLQMLVTDPAPPLVPCLLAHADRHLTMKQTDHGNVLIGGAWTAATGPAGQPVVLPESLEGNTWVAAQTIPALADLAVIRSWAAMNIDIDGAPLIGHLPGHPRVTVAATANGYTLGPLVGREAVALALDGQARADIAAFSFDRFDESNSLNLGETSR